MRTFPSSMIRWFAVAAIATVVAPTVQAAIQTYDSTHGSDVWDVSTTNWLPGPAAWTNANDAVFGGTGETVDVDAAISAVRLTFSVGGYTIADSNNNGSLTLTGTGAGSTSAIRAGAAGLTTISENILLGAANGSTQSFDAVTSGTLALSGNISENASAGIILSLSGAANTVITLSGSNSHSGGTTTAASNLTINLNNSHALGTGTFSITGNTGTTVDNTTGGVTLNNNGFTLGGATAGSTGASNVIFKGSGDINFGNGTVTLSGADKAIRVDAGTVTLGGTIVEDSSARALFKNGSGILALTATNSSFSGLLNINAGTLEVKSLANGGSNSSIGKGGSAASNLVINNGATLKYTGAGSSTDRLFTISNGATGATIESSGSGALKFTGTGAMGHGGTLTSTRLLILGGNNADDNTIALSIGNTGSAGGITSLTKNGTGRWILTGANTYTGNTTINGGVLQVVDGVGILSGSGVVQIRGGVLQSSGTFSRNVTTSVGGVNWSTSSGGFAAIGAPLVLQLNNGTGSITWNASSFVQTGQSLIFGSASADNVVDFQNSIALASGTANNGLIRTITVIDNPNSTADRARISGTINSISSATNNGIIKDGDGVLELTGNNSYTGSTTVSAGTLIINGNNGSATGAVTVSSGATLAGSGTIGGAATIENNGTLAPGSSAGLLTFTSSLTFSGTDSKATFEIATGARGTNFDAVNVTGALTYNGDLTLGMAGLIANGTYNLFTFGSQTGSFDTIAFGGVGNPYSGSFSNSLGVWTAISASQTFTFTQSTGSLTVIPEPSSMVLALASGAVLLAFRRRRNNA